MTEPPSTSAAAPAPTSELARREQSAVQRNVAGAKGGDVERRSEVEPDDVSVAAARDGAPRPSAAKRIRRPGGDDRDAGMGGVLGRATWPSGPRCEADRRNAARTPVRGGGEAVCVRRRAWRGGGGGGFAGTAAAPRGVELLRLVAGLPVAVHSGGREAGGVAARPGLLQLCRPAQRPALRLPLSAGDRPHRPVRARRRCGAGEFATSLRSPSQVAPRSPS